MSFQTEMRWEDQIFDDTVEPFLDKSGLVEGTVGFPQTRLVLWPAGEQAPGTERKYVRFRPRPDHVSPF